MTDDAHAELATLAALHAARDTGVLDALLDSADTPTEIAAATGVDAHAAAVLVDVLTDRGHFERVDGAVEPTNRALGLLAKTDLRSIGRRPHEIDRFAAYAALPDRLDGDAATSPAPIDDRNRLGYLQATPDADRSRAVDAATRVVPDPERVLDLGGAPGPYATEFAARGHAVVLRDRPARIDAARALLEPREIALDPGALAPSSHPPTEGLDRETEAVDRFPSVDLVFASDLTPRLDDDALDRATSAAHDALTRPPAAESDATTDDTDEPTDEPSDEVVDGERALVWIEHVRGHSPGASTRRFDALATGAPGEPRTEARLRDSLAGAGFPDVTVRSIDGLDRHVVVATP
jgi:hypothetical protein